MIEGQQKKLRLLFTPSGLSGLLVVTVGLLVFIGPLFFYNYGHFLQQGVAGTQQYLNGSQLTQSIGNNFLANNTVGNVVLALLWGGVGCVLYFTGANIVSKLHAAASATKTLKRAGAARKPLTYEIGVRLLVQVTALICWWLVLRLLMYKLIPASIAYAHTVALSPASPAAWLHNVIAAVWCMLGTHALTIAFRLMLLRPRLGVAI